VRIFNLVRSSLIFILAPLTFLVAAQAQNTQPAPTRRVEAPPTIAVPSQERAPARVAGSRELACSGYITYVPPSNPIEIVGGEQEDSQYNYSQGNVIYVNQGSRHGIHVGQEFSVIRPRGMFHSPFSRKHGFLGNYVEEVGQVRVTEVREQTSVAVVTSSCEVMLLGDVLVGVQQRVSPVVRADVPLEHFRDPNGKPQGRIVLARDFQEMVTRGQVVYIDLGWEDNVKPGDYLTIFRPSGTGNITRFRDEEVTMTGNNGFESDRYHGGVFSIQAQRNQYPNTQPYGPMITTPRVKRNRPPVPRKVVGEMVILGVQERTATAIITRVSQEVHTGDYVEIQ